MVAVKTMNVEYFLAVLTIPIIYKLYLIDLEIAQANNQLLQNYNAIKNSTILGNFWNDPTLIPTINESILTFFGEVLCRSCIALCAAALIVLPFAILGLVLIFPITRFMFTISVVNYIVRQMF